MYNERSMTTPHRGEHVSESVDWLILLIVAVASIVVFIGTALTTGFALASDSQIAWYLIRAAGMTAYSLLAASTIWGLFLSSRLIKDWTPGTVSMLFHSTISWLAVVFSLAHVGLLLFDTYYSYKLTDLVIPFVGPYRPFAVGLGIISIWLILAVTISFSFRKLIGHRAWLWLHYTSYIAFVLVTAHALLAGTDGTQPGMLAIMGISTFLVFALLAVRVARTPVRKLPKSSRSV